MLKLKIEELSTLEPGGYEDSRIVKSCVPVNMSILVPKAENGMYSVISRITWLCKTVQDTLFCLTTNYIAEDQDDEEFLVSNPLLDDRYFANYKLSSDILMKSLSHFITDLNFTFSNGIHRANDIEISCQALEIKEEVNGDKLHKIMVSPEVFASMKFIDNYILDGIYNNADLNSAIVLGADENNNTFIYNIKDAEVVSVAPTTNKRKVDNIAVKVNIIPENDKDPSAELLFPINIGKEYKRKMFKRVTLDDLTKDYLVNETQFISKYCFSTTTNAAESEDYLFVNGIDYLKNRVLFAFSPEVQESIIKQINIILEK